MYTPHPPALTHLFLLLIECLGTLCPASNIRIEHWLLPFYKLPLAYMFNRIYNKILNRDWFSARLFVT